MSLAGVGAIQVRPSEPSQGAGLTSALLRTRLSAALKNNGTVDMLKSQLRAKVLSELRSSSLAVSESSKKARPLVEQAANLLIMDYLQNSGYLCTASVFAPESGVPVAASGSLSDTEFLREVQQVLDLLHIHPDSRLYKRMMSVRGTSAIRTLLEYVTHSADQAPGVTNSACQTTATETQTIDRKMEQINERYRGLAHENAMAPLKTLEERLAQCQRDADARIRAEVEEAVTTLRKVEMSKMRLEEQAKYSQQLAQVRDEMESTWQKRLDALREREKEIAEKASKKEDEMEGQLYAHRQRMLSDMEMVRRRDAESRKHAEDTHQHIMRQETRCRELEHELEVKLAQLERDRAELSREREAELARIRADMLRLRDEEQRELAGQRREVEEQRIQLQIQRDSFGDAMAEAKVAREECVELKAECKRQQQQMEMLREELQRKSERLVEKEDECRRLDEEARRTQERFAELETARKEQASLHLGGSVAGTPHSLRSSLKGGSGRASPSKSHSTAGAAVIMDQLDEMRASHGRERVIKEKQVIQLQSELKRAGRDITSLQQRLSDLQREHDVCEARLKESERLLMTRSKELEDVKLQLKMTQHEADDARHLLEQSQLALERDRRRVSDHDKVSNILLGSARATARGLHDGSLEDERPLLASLGPLLTGRDSSAPQGRERTQGADDNAWELELNRLLTTIGELEKEDKQLRSQRELMLSNQRHERLLRDLQPARDGVPVRPPVKYAWGGTREEEQNARVGIDQRSMPRPAQLPDVAQHAGRSVSPALSPGKASALAVIAASPSSPSALVAVARGPESPVGSKDEEQRTRLPSLQRPSSPGAAAQQEAARRRLEDEERKQSEERQRLMDAAKDEQVRREKEAEETRRLDAEEEEMRRLAAQDAERAAREEEKRRQAEVERLALERRREEKERQEAEAEKRAQEERRRQAEEAAEKQREEDRQRRDEEEQVRKEEEKRKQEEVRREEDRKLKEAREEEERRLMEAERQQRVEEEAERERAREAKKREEEELQIKRGREERERKEIEEREEREREEERRKKEEEEKLRLKEEEERRRVHEEEEERQRAEAEQGKREMEVKELVQKGMDALNEGNLEEAERLYAAATRAHEGLQPANVDLAANVKALNRSVQAAQQARIKRTVLALMDQARRELGDKDAAGNTEVENARDRMQQCRQEMESLDEDDLRRDELLDQMEEIDDDIESAQIRIATQERKKEGASMLAAGGGGDGGGSAEGSGGGGSGAGSAGSEALSPARSDSIVEDFDFDEGLSGGSGSADAWGQVSVGEDEDSGGW